MGRFSMRKITELLRQRFESKLSYRDIARSLNISVSTVSDYLSRARAAEISWPLPEGISEDRVLPASMRKLRLSSRWNQPSS